MKKHIIAVCLLISTFGAHAQIITTVAGNGTDTTTGDGAAALSAGIAMPYGICIDGSGNIFITTDNRVRKINISGIITTVAGNGTFGFSGDGGLATAAQLASPPSVVFDAGGNMYIASGLSIRKVTPAGTISTIAGDGITPGFSGDSGPATSALVWGVGQMCFDGSGNLLFTDMQNNRVRKITPTGIISTIAGNGTGGYSGDGSAATSAELNLPAGLAIDAAGNIYVGDVNNYVIRKINTSGTISTVAGTNIDGYGGDDAAAISCKLGGNMGHLFIDGSGNLYVPDGENARIRKISTAGVITTIAGSGTTGFAGDGGAALSAQFASPSAVAINASGDMYIIDQFNNRIRRVQGVTGVHSVTETSKFLSVYPNPAVGSTTVILQSDISEAVAITVTNVLGEEVKKTAGLTNMPVTLSLDFPKGCYYITVITAHGTWVEKMAVE